MFSSPASITPWPSKIRVAVADDRTLFREALVHLLGDRDRVDVVAAGPATAAGDLIAQHQPDVLLLGAPDGAAAAACGLAGAGAATRVVVIGCGRDDLPGLVLTAGAAGFVAFDAQPDELVAAIGAVHSGERVPASAASDDDPVAVLSPRELETLRFLAVGMTNREIAMQLGISVKTVDTHRGHVLKKLRLRNNSDLTRFALQHGLVELGSQG
ncbi:MAG: response regulator transcription factor [Kofleriaceae bacterium]|nr:response regulator transcription factor [Kofleriaceae bacterium]